MNERPPIRILSINTWKCDGDYELRMQALVRQMMSVDPDIITIQESFRTTDGAIDTAALLASKFGMQYSFAQARRKIRTFKAREIESDSGLATLSRLPILAAERLVLPTDSPTEERVALLTTIDWHGALVNIANVHFTHLPDRLPLKRAQLGAVLDALAADDEMVCRIKLICGDFNTPQREELLSGQDTWTFLDSYVLGGGPSDRATIRGIGVDWPEPVCIDYILYARKSTESVRVRFETSAIVLNQPDEHTGVFPSDHFGVMTTMSFLNGG